MLTVSLAHTEARLSELTDKIENGEEVVITRRGRPAARLGPIEPRRQPIDVKAMGAYTLSNRGTWLSFGKTGGGLTVLIEGAPTRNDIYGGCRGVRRGASPPVTTDPSEGWQHAVDTPPRTPLITAIHFTRDCFA